MLIQAYWNPCLGRSHCHWWHRRQARRHHCNWSSSSWSCGQNVRHNALQKSTRVIIWTSHVLIHPPTDGGNTPKPLLTEGNAHITYWYPRNIPMHREPLPPPMTGCGCVRGAPPCQEGVPTQGSPLQPPQHAKPPNPHRGTEEYGGIWGCVHPWEVYEHTWGIQTYGGIQAWGCPDTPKYKYACH